jgi:hypothetical protein
MPMLILEKVEVANLETTRKIHSLFFFLLYSLPKSQCLRMNITYNLRDPSLGGKKIFLTCGFSDKCQCKHKNSKPKRSCPQTCEFWRCSLNDVACVVLTAAVIDEVTVLPETHENAQSL